MERERKGRSKKERRNDEVEKREKERQHLSVRGRVTENSEHFSVSIFAKVSLLFVFFPCKFFSNSFGSQCLMS